MFLAALFACTGATPDDSGARPGAVADDGVAVALPYGAVLKTTIPFAAEPGAELAVRVTWNPQAPARYEDGRPVVLLARGSLGAGSFLTGRSMTPWIHAGFVLVEMLLPGGSDDGQTSTGTFDTRGPLGQLAFAEVANWGAGASRDGEGRTLSDLVPDALPWVGLVGTSAGVNLTLAALGRDPAFTPGVRFLVAWEGPFTDQFVDVEFESPEFHLNPAYELGSCGDTTCEMPTLPAMLAFDADAVGYTEVPLGADRVDLEGVFYVDENADGVYIYPEYSWHMIAHGDNPETLVTTPSVELSSMIDTEAERLFAGGARPAWLPSTEWLREFWSLRDASLVIPALALARPDLPFIVAASRKDHIYIGVPDSPHVRSLTHFLQAQGFSFVRLNPDASYLAAMADVPTDALPDNDAGDCPTWPDTPQWLEPELGEGILDRYAATAAALELADRVHQHDFAPNLTQPFFDVPPP
ncbi:MAG: hypothetical protein EXR71_03615 [Myxococcales bacterium]|nr:hypothetical protein [Myxococcales bacterium]